MRVLFIFGDEIVQPVFVAHQHMQLMFELGEFCAEMPFILGKGKRYGLKRSELGETKCKKQKRGASSRPRQPREPQIFRRRFHRGAAQVYAHLRREMLPVIFRSFRQRNGFQPGFEFRIVHEFPPLEFSQRFNFFFAANTLHETVVSGQRKIFAASA